MEKLQIEELTELYEREKQEMKEQYEAHIKEL